MNKNIKKIKLKGNYPLTRMTEITPQRLKDQIESRSSMIKRFEEEGREERKKDIEFLKNTTKELMEIEKEINN